MFMKFNNKHTYLPDMKRKAELIFHFSDGDSPSETTYDFDYNVSDEDIRNKLNERVDNWYSMWYKTTKTSYKIGNIPHSSLLDFVDLIDLNGYLFKIFHPSVIEHLKDFGSASYDTNETEDFFKQFGYKDSGFIPSKLLYDKENNIIFAMRGCVNFKIALPMKDITEVKSFDDIVVVYDYENHQEQNTTIDTKYINNEYRIFFENYFQEIIDHVSEIQLKIEMENKVIAMRNDIIRNKKKEFLEKFLADKKI